MPVTFYFGNLKGREKFVGLVGDTRIILKCKRMNDWTGLRGFRKGYNNDGCSEHNTDIYGSIK